MALVRPPPLEVGRGREPKNVVRYYIACGEDLTLSYSESSTTPSASSS